MPLLFSLLSFLAIVDISSGFSAWTSILVLLVGAAILLRLTGIIRMDWRWVFLGATLGLLLSTNLFPAIFSLGNCEFRPPIGEFTAVPSIITNLAFLKQCVLGVHEPVHFAGSPLIIFQDIFYAFAIYIEAGLIFLFFIFSWFKKGVELLETRPKIEKTAFALVSYFLVADFASMAIPGLRYASGLKGGLGLVSSAAWSVRENFLPYAIAFLVVDFLAYLFLLRKEYRLAGYAFIAMGVLVLTVLFIAIFQTFLAWQTMVTLLSLASLRILCVIFAGILMRRRT